MYISNTWLVLDFRRMVVGVAVSVKDIYKNLQYYDFVVCTAIIYSTICLVRSCFNILLLL